jgi:hypothetical protein
LQREVDLAKAALLYADEVEMVSVSVAMIDGLREVTQGEYGFVDLLSQVDAETLAYLGGGDLPDDWHRQLDLLMSLDPAHVRSLNPAAAAQVAELQDQFREMSRSTQADMQGVLEGTGSAELVPAIRAGVLRVADLSGVNPAATVRPPGLGGDPGEPLDAMMWTWMDTLVQRLNNPKVHLLFDDTVGRLVQSMLDAGMIEASDANLRLTAQAALGSGFVSRLPAFPQARMDELLDLRGDLRSPLRRYRAAVGRFSRQIPHQVGASMSFEVQEMWNSEVVPELTNLTETLAEHGLVRELARAVQATDIRSFGVWTAGTYLALDQGTDQSTLMAGVASAAVVAGPRVGQALINSYRERASAHQVARRNDWYYLYQANERLEALRERRT